MWLVALLLVTAAMAPRPGARTRVELGRNFVLKIGGSAVIEPSDTLFRFDDVVEDSRCPKGAMCIRAGNARVAVRLELPDGRVEHIELNTAEGPRYAVSGGLRIELLAVEPYPVVHRPIDREAYEAAFVVTTSKRKRGRDERPFDAPG